LETSPALVYTWGLWQQNISIGQVVEPTRVICFAARWHGEKSSAMFSAEWSGETTMHDLLHELLTEADAVCHWNGDTFDLPHIRRELLEHGYPPLPPIRSIDLLKHVKRNYRFLSNKLDWVSGELLGEHKTKHEGFGLWRRVLAGDEKARALMERYNKRDVILTDRLLTLLRPHLDTMLPTAGLFSEAERCCPKCGRNTLQKRGFHYTTVSKFQRFQCTSCGAWSRGGLRVGKVDVR
jgi:hypothetical protein